MENVTKSDLNIAVNRLETTLVKWLFGPYIFECGHIR